MADAEAKGEVPASGSELVNKVSEKNTGAETTVSEVVKLDVEVATVISGSEEVRENNKKEENESSVKSPNAALAASELVNTEPAESELVNMEIEVPVSVSGLDGKKEEKRIADKKGQNNTKKVNSGKNAPKKKIKKVAKPGNNTSKNVATAETATEDPVKLNAEVGTANAAGESKTEDGKKEQTKEKQPTTPGELSKKRKRKRRATKPVKKASLEVSAVKTAAPEPLKSTAEVSIATGSGENSKEDKKEETKVEQNNKEKDDLALPTSGENSKKRKRKKNRTVIGSDKTETSEKDKDPKKSASKGMIFMCSSKTKQDCYRYKVFGLPAGKKDVVAKIYKGMRLFLFDIDLKLLYGIYKAAGPGGYNLEPKAFKSAFPSQVRFSVMEDCLPLAEEKFKVAIKDNYYGKNKFNCQLNADQVKNLCKLFKMGRQSKQVERDHKPEPHSVVERNRERRQGQDKERRQGQDRERRQGQDRERQQRRDRERRQGRDREKRQGRERREGRDRVREPASGRDYRVSQPDGLYEREVYAPTMLPVRPPHHVLAPPAYPYERSLDVDSYRRDPLVERRMLDLELSRREEIPYHREPLVYSRDPPALEPHLSYHEPLYSRAPPVDEPHHPYNDRPYAATRALPPAQEPPLSYHESVYARAPPSYPLSSLYRY